jgi:hypothetical protein
LTVKKEYLQLTIEELIQNRDFIAWVLRDKKQNEWEIFLAENPEFKSTAKKARKIVKLLRDSQDHLSEDDILNIWKNIESFDEQIQAHTRQIKFRTFLRYAAVLIVALSISSVGYWFLYQNQKSYVFTSVNDHSTNNQSQLFLSNGTTVDLEKENSEIALNSNQQIMINNEQVIDLSKNG